MVNLCDDLSELKILVRCVLVASIDALTIDELWKRVTYILGGPHVVQLELFGYNTVLDFLKNIPDVVQLEDTEDANSIVNLVSSDLSRYMEQLVSTNIIRPPNVKNKIALSDLLIPYRTQCAFIRIFIELYPQGLSIDDFVSDILCVPLFKSYANNIDMLLFNLNHIFKKDGSEMISLQSTLINNVNDIMEEDKFTAIDIYNIDENSLEDENEDKRIANGLEYSLYHILEEPIRNNIELLLNEGEPGWIPERKICNLYIEKFGSAFSHYRRWGFKRVSQFFSKLPELCFVHFLDNDGEIISIKNYSCDMYNKMNLVKKKNDSELFSISEKNESENEPKENDGVLIKFLRNDPFLKASLNDCFLDQEIQHFVLHANKSFDVKVCRIMCLTPTILCQSLDRCQELKNLLTDMKTFYFINESKFAFDPTITMLKHTYAFSLGDLWFRGIVLDINLNKIKMMNIDNGVICDVMLEDIRMLYKQFSQLPAQAFTCHLHGIESVDEDKLSQIVNNTCTIYVVTTDRHNKYARVKIKLMNSTSNEYLNDEWLKSGVAEPCCSSSDEE